MLFISKQHLCVYRSRIEIDEIEKQELRGLVEAMPSNTIYFETDDGKLYGLVTHGDILTARNGMVSVNKSFVSLSRSAYMEARERFRKADTIFEIPVVENGELVGEFDRFDDELMLDRARSLEYNAYAAAYFARFQKTALVKPTRAYKMRYFEKLKHILGHYGVGYTIIGFADIASNLDNFDTFFVVDEQERRGAKIIFDLFEEKPHLLYKVITFLHALTKLESAEVMDYKQVFFGLKQKGVRVILMTAKPSTSEYVLGTERKMRERFPIVMNNLYELMKPYEKEFFDDLYENEDYVRDIKSGYFVVEKDQSIMRLRDTHSNYINVEHGERVTIGQPDDYTRTVYFFGPCLVIGSYVGDEYTIESRLQAMVNDAGYKVRVVNCGCWGGNVASVSRMLSTLIREGDIVVMLPENPGIGISGLEEMDLWNALEKHQVPAEWLLDKAYHANHHASEVYARELFDLIFDENYRDNEENRTYIAQSLNVVDEFFIQKYFHGQDLGRFGTVACCVFNGSPFTNGHRHLIETASEATDHVYLLSLKEDSSLFSFNERYAMAVDATNDLDNVTVVPSGLFIGNINSFPAYYAKMYVGNIEEQASTHVETYASVATLLHATHRFVGDEPGDPISNEINKASKRILPRYGIETVIVKRKEDAGGVITGTRIRELAAQNNPEFADLVPEVTADIIRCASINAF